MYRDLRSYIDRLEQERLLERVQETVDPQWEINGITNTLMSEQGPAVLFESVKGSDVRVAAGLLHTPQRLALALGLDRDTDEPTLRSVWWERTQNPISPRLVTDAPCKENILTGEQADLRIFPEFRWHSADVGTYFGTLGMSVTRNPETQALNVGIYRMLTLSPTEATFFAMVYQHGGMHFSLWELQGKSMPAAIVFGGPPVCVMVAASKFRQPPDEWEVAGGLLQEPLDVVRCETSDLLVPATAEIVLEGEVEAGRREICGPFGEFPGYYGEAMPSAVFRLKTITHRTRPIYYGTREGKPPTESAGLFIGTRSYTFGRVVREWPGVKDGVITIAGTSYHAVVSMESQYPGHAQEIGNAILGGDFGNLKRVIVVDADVDVRDPKQVEWAVSTRVEPARDIQRFSRHRGGSLDLSQVPSWEAIGDKIIVDATMPLAEEGDAALLAPIARRPQG